jgi:flagellar biosynthesis protein FliQ
MNADTVTSLAMQALTVTLAVSMPFLLTGLAVGLVVSVFQAVTSIQEPTLTFIPKILATGAVLAIGGPWMLDQMLVYMHNLYVSIPSMVGP